MFLCKQNKKRNKQKEIRIIIKIAKTKRQKFRYGHRRHVYVFEFLKFLKAFYFNFLQRFNF